MPRWATFMRRGPDGSTREPGSAAAGNNAYGFASAGVIFHGGGSGMDGQLQEHGGVLGNVPGADIRSDVEYSCMII